MKIAQSIMSMLYLDEVMIRFRLSKDWIRFGLSSPVLENQELLENVAIRNTHPSRKGDFDIVQRDLQTNLIDENYCYERRMV